MNGYQFVASLVESLAWPVVTGNVLYLLRGQFGGILERVSNFKAGTVEANFRESLSAIEQETTISNKHADSGSTQKCVEHSVSFSDLADYSPNSAIIESWNGIENAVIELAAATGTNKHIANYGLERFPDKYASRLQHVMKQYNSLRSMRNKVAHSGGQAGISSDMAKRYVSIAEFVENEIRNVIPE